MPFFEKRPDGLLLTAHWALQPMFLWVRSKYPMVLRVRVGCITKKLYSYQWRSYHRTFRAHAPPPLPRKKFHGLNSLLKIEKH